MAIELAPRRKPKISLITTILGVVAVFLALSFLGSYLYFYIVNKGLMDNIQESERSSAELDKTITEKESVILSSQRRIDDFSSILQNHKNMRNVFEFIDKNTIPSVWFYNFEFNEKENNKVTVDGKTNSFFIIEQQISIFNKQDMVKKAELEDINIDEKEGFIDYSIAITFDPKVFAYEPSVLEEEPSQGLEKPAVENQ